jgi:hypothetical protein
MFNCLYKAYQKSKMNWLLQLDTIELGSLCSLKTYLIEYSATETASIKSINTIYRIFVRWLTTTIIFVNLLLLGKSTTKLIKISRHLCIGIGNS